MKCTNQPTSPPTAQNSKDEITQDEAEKMNHKVAEACSKRGEKCLNNLTSSSQAHFQQPNLK